MSKQIKLTDALRKTFTKQIKYYKSVNGYWSGYWKYADGYTITVSEDANYHIAKARIARRLMDAIETRQEFYVHGIPGLTEAQTTKVNKKISK